MSGYSKTPLSKKIGFKVGTRWDIIDGFNDLDELLSPLPEGTMKLNKEDNLDILIWCCNSLNILEDQMSSTMERIHKAGMMGAMV